MELIRSAQDYCGNVYCNDFFDMLLVFVLLVDYELRLAIATASWRTFTNALYMRRARVFGLELEITQNSNYKKIMFSYCYASTLTRVFGPHLFGCSAINALKRPI